MPSFSRSYIEPGVYFQIKDVLLPNIQAGDLAGVIIGTGKLTKDFTDTNLVCEAVSGSDPKITLTKSGNYFTGISSPIKSIIKQGVLINAEVDLNSITFTPSTGVISSPDFEVGASYTVEYTINKLDEEDFELKFFGNLDGVKLIYGDLASSLEYTLPLGAKLFFDNGGQYLGCVQLNPADGDTATQFQKAIDKLSLSSKVYTVVPLIGIDPVTNTSLATYLKNHVETNSSVIERKNRIALIGGSKDFDKADTPDEVSDSYASFATGLKSSRLAIIAPSAIKVTLPTESGSTQVTVDGCYLAAAISGIICNNNYTGGESITGKLIAGVDDIVEVFSRAQKNKMAGSGIFIVERNMANLIAIRHALSTDVSSISLAELKITRLKDIMAIKTILPTLESLFINTRNLGSETLSSIRYTVMTILEGFIRRNDIIAMEDLSVSVDSTDPRQVNVSFKIRPSWDINWILVSFGVTI